MLPIVLKESHSHSSTAQVQSEALKITLSKSTECLVENIVKNMFHTDNQFTKTKSENDTENGI